MMKIEFLDQIFFKNLRKKKTVLFYSKFPEILGTLGKSLKKSLKNKTSIKKKMVFYTMFHKNIEKFGEKLEK